MCLRETPAASRENPRHCAMISMRPAARERTANRRFERREAGLDIRAEMHAQRAPPALRQHLEIAARLCRLEQAEP